MKKYFHASILLSQFLLGTAYAAQFSVSLEKPPGDVHPLRSNTLEAVLIGNQIYEPLVSIGPSGEIQPLLLESWSYDPARNRFDFKLKNNVRFSDGTSLTSDRVIETFKKIIAANRVQNFSRIKGAQAFAEKRADDVAGLRTKDSLNFSIELDVSYPRFLADLADPYASIFLEQAHSLPLGTGPYMFKEVSSSGKEVFVTRSPEAVSSHTGFDTIVFTSEPNEKTDIYFGEPSDPADSRLRKLEYFDTEVVFLAFNAANPALTDAQTRRFLGSLLTKEMIDESLGPVPYKIGGYIPLGTAGYNPALSFPGHPAPDRLPKTLTVFSYMPRLAPLAEKYCAALKRRNISCQLKIASVDDMYKAKADNSLQVVFLRQKSTTYSVEYLLSCFTSPSLCNIFTTKRANPVISRQMDDLFDQMLRTPAEQRAALLDLYKKMDSAVLSDALVKPIRYGANKVVWYDKRLSVPALDTLGPFGMRLENVKIAQ